MLDIASLLNTQAGFYAVFFGTSVMSGIVFAALLKGIAAAYKRRLVITAVIPEVPGEFITFSRVRKQAGGVWTRKKGDEGTATILAGDAAYPSNWGPVHLTDKNGFNLVAPTKDAPGVDAKTGKDIKADPVSFKRYRIWDHLIYWRACRENDMEDLYSAQREKDHWAVKLAPMAIILFIGMMGFMGFLLWKLMPMLQRVA